MILKVPKINLEILNQFSFRKQNLLLIKYNYLKHKFLLVLIRDIESLTEFQLEIVSMILVLKIILRNDLKTKRIHPNLIFSIEKRNIVVQTQ